MTTHSRTQYHIAQAFIKSHGIECTVTLDGLLASSMVLDRTKSQDDCWYEESTIFPISDDNTVDRKAIRNWLGY